MFQIFTFLGGVGTGLFLMIFFFPSQPTGLEGPLSQGPGHAPPVCGVQLHSDHIEGVPGRDGQPVVQAQHADHHGLAGAEPQEEAADA